MPKQRFECPYHPTSKFSLDLFISYLNRIKVSNHDISGDENYYTIILDKFGIKKLDPLFSAIDFRYPFLNRLRSARDYEIVLNYDQTIKLELFFKKVEQFQFKTNENWFSLSAFSPYFLTNHTLGIINTEKEDIIKTLWSTSRLRFLSISNNGQYSIVKTRSKYSICNNKTKRLSPIESLSVNKNYVFIFNNTDKNFGAIDSEGQFTYFSISNQPLIKIKLDIDSYLSIKHIFESRHIITDEVIYNFSGDKVHSASDKYVFHYFDHEFMIRENLFSQKLEVVGKNNQIFKFEMYHDRLIHKVLLIENKILIVIYEDELIDFINIYTDKKMSVFTPEKIIGVSQQGNKLLILLSTNILQVVELNY